MLELGEDSQMEHREILDYIIHLNPSLLFFVGSEFESAANGDDYYSRNALFFKTSANLRLYLESNTPKEMTFLIKGSRGTRLEKVLDII